MEPFLPVLVGSISSKPGRENALADMFVVRRPLRYAHLLPLSDLDGEKSSSQGSESLIRCLDPWATVGPYNFPPNLAPGFTHYLSERPEMSSQ